MKRGALLRPRENAAECLPPPVMTAWALFRSAAALAATLAAGTPEALATHIVSVARLQPIA